MADDTTRPLTVGEWFVTMLVLAIPLVNIVMGLVWAFGSGGNINRRNYCRAALIWMAIGIVLAISFAVMGGIAALAASAAANS
jgi:hypothetical protein